MAPASSLELCPNGTHPQFTHNLEIKIKPKSAAADAYTPRPHFGKNCPFRTLREVVY